MLRDLPKDYDAEGWVNYHRDPLLEGLPAEISLQQPAQTLGERLMLLVYLRPVLSQAAFSLLHHENQRAVRTVVPSHEIEDFQTASFLRKLQRLG